MRAEPMQKELTELMSGLPQLTHLTLSNVDCIEDAALAPLLDQVEELTLKKCVKMSNDTLNAFQPKLTNLKRLKLVRCPQLTGAGLANLPNPETVEELDLLACDAMTDNALNALWPKLTNLKQLKLANCPRLIGAGLANLPNPEKVEELDLSGCKAMTDNALNALLLKLTNLEQLRLANCKWLTGTGLANIPNPEKLKVLDLSGCKEATGDVLIALLPRLTNLWRLDLSNCGWLTGAMLTNLTKIAGELILSGCERIDEEALDLLLSERTNVSIVS